jgi:hypothetical protein
MLSRLVFWIALHPPVLRLRRQGDLDPSVLITHDLPLEAGVEAYDLFKKKADGCIRVALRPYDVRPSSPGRLIAEEVCRI